MVSMNERSEACCLPWVSALLTDVESEWKPTTSLLLCFFHRTELKLRRFASRGDVVVVVAEAADSSMGATGETLSNII